MNIKYLQDFLFAYLILKYFKLRRVVEEMASRIIDKACQKKDFVSLRKVVVTSVYVNKSIANIIKTPQAARLKIQPSLLDSNKSIPDIIKSKPNNILN